MSEEKQEKKQQGKEHLQKPLEKEAQPNEELNLIVRVASVDLKGHLSIVRALTKIKGIGLRTAKNMTIIFEKQTGVNRTEILGKISNENVKILEKIVQTPLESGIPSWALNRQKDYETGENLHLLMADLSLSLRQDVQRLSEIKTYKGFRHTWGLPLRGQRTKSTHRKKGGTVGVTKKDVKAGK
ncbi:30S ribosomal protein S13 [archaeon]|nr:30S ribosomal protein S13 [archaeon]